MTQKQYFTVMCAKKL